MPNAPIHITQTTPSPAQRKLPYPWPSGHFLNDPYLGWVPTLTSSFTGLGLAEGPTGMAGQAH